MLHYKILMQEKPVKRKYREKRHKTHSKQKVKWQTNQIILTLSINGLKNSIKVQILSV